MKATISLKQLRTDPREYIRLLNNGYEVIITEHRRELARARAEKVDTLKQGDGKALLAYIKDMPKMEDPFPGEDTVQLAKRTRLRYLERKFGYRK